MRGVVWVLPVHKVVEEERHGRRGHPLQPDNRAMTSESASAPRPMACDLNASET